MVPKIIHTILDVVSMWISYISVFFCAIYFTPVYLIFALLFTIPFAKRTFRWIIFWIDYKRDNIQTIITKSYVFHGRYRIYELDITRKIHYSIIKFDDPRLKGDFIDLSDERHRNGDKLEVVYYKKSRVIKSITKIDN